VIYAKNYPAGNGDAFLFRTDSAEPTAILIDAGYAATFQKHILPDLAALAATGYRLDLAVVTHIDADHISGFLPLLKANGSSEKPQIIGIGQVFHNSLRNLASPPLSAVRVSKEDLALLGEIRGLGFPKPKSVQTDATEISMRQGSSVSALLKAGGYRWNLSDGTKSVTGDGQPVLKIGERITVTVLGPTRLRLEKLNAWWLAELRRLGYTGPVGSGMELDDVFEFLCAKSGGKTGHLPQVISASDFNPNRTLKDVYNPDDSVTNASSISMIVEVKSARLLLLGDSCAEDTVEALRGRFDSDGPHVFDAIKLSHHGSARNTSPALLDLVDSPIYLISTNGEGHGHPDFEVLKAIIDRPANFSRELYFNYPTTASARLKAHVSASHAPFVVHEGSNGWIALGGQSAP